MKKKILFSMLAIAAAAAIVIGGTTAFFSDTETSTGNTFTAGAIDLKVDSKCTYNDAQSNECGTWEMTDLGPTNKFFDFGDLKPGDEGENTISLHVFNNDAYVCAYINNMYSDDNGLTEPESLVDTTGGFNEGELDDEVYFFAWLEKDGDNVYESNEIQLFSNVSGPASDVLNGKTYPLFTPGTLLALPADQTAYVGMYWCYGKLTVNGYDLSCDGSAVTNLTQTDSMSADISFYVEQARNNLDFVCPALGNDLVRYTADLENKTANWDVIADDGIYGELSYTSLPGSKKLVGKVEGFGLTPNRKYQISLTGQGPCGATDILLATAGSNLFESGYWNLGPNLDATCNISSPGQGTYNMGVTDGTNNYYTVITDSSGDFVYDFEINALDAGTYTGVKVIVKLLLENWASPWVDTTDVTKSNIMEVAPITFTIN